jgi:type IV pilus assembly protein PilE
MGRARQAGGFTLIEVMVAVAIIAILVSLAIPSYQEHLRKGRRAEAQSYLMDLANLEQQYLLDARSYATGGTAITTLNKPAPVTVTNFYDITIADGATTAPPTFVITATPKAGTAQETDGVLTIDESGAKTRAGVSGW